MSDNQPSPGVTFSRGVRRHGLSVCQAMAVAQAGSLLRRSVTCIRRVLRWGVKRGRASAGYQPAIRQIANLRYDQAVRTFVGDEVTSLHSLPGQVRASLRRLLRWFGLLAVLLLSLPALTAAEFSFHSGELHATRIPREHWAHRLQMAKALGLTTVSTYVFWSRHEPEPGKFDWSGEGDLTDCCRQAARSAEHCTASGSADLRAERCSALPGHTLTDHE